LTVFSVGQQLISVYYFIPYVFCAVWSTKSSLYNVVLTKFGAHFSKALQQHWPDAISDVTH